MKSNANCSMLILAALLSQCAYSEDLEQPSLMELVRRLDNFDEHTRPNAEAAERQLIKLKTDAAEAILHAACRTPNPPQKVVAATSRILQEWEAESWTDPESAAAVDRFVQLARDHRNISGKDVPLGPQAATPFASIVRVLDVTPEAAADFLLARPGITISSTQGFYRGVTFGSLWVTEPHDWLYVPNLAREIPGTAYADGRYHPIDIQIMGDVDGGTLAECLRNLRKLRNSPFSLYVGQAQVDRESLVVLRSYRELTRLSANCWGDNITDEDWAMCISSWPKCESLYLSGSAGTKAIAAISELEDLIVVTFGNSDLTERDLEPLRGRNKLNTLWVWDAETEEAARTGKPGWEKRSLYIEYINQQGTGKWQLEEARPRN